MNLETIDVYSLKDSCYLSAIRCDNFSEAAAVCLDNCNHPQEVVLTVQGELETQFKLVWREVTDQIKDSRNDLEYATEDGAYCLALLILEKTTDYKVVKQSRKETGFDYWLANRDNTAPFHPVARLEISGILKGTNAQINQLIKKKLAQTKRSDDLDMPAYIVVVEFSRPVLKIIKNESNRSVT